MANLDSSWQASVIKLAQAGNLRAIAFWLNRYLVPQGVCAQVVAEEPGNLLIRVMCRQVPDRDRLVRFICHRLCKLDSPVIQNVRITAQVVGTSDILWDKAARISSASEKQPAGNLDNVHPLPQPQPVEAVSVPETPVAVPVSEVSVASAAPIGAVSVDGHSTLAAQPVPAILPNALPQPLVKFASVAQMGSAIDRLKPLLDQPIHYLTTWTQSLTQKTATLRTIPLDLTSQSVRWFTRQKPPVRGAVLGGAAVAAFLMGCGVELVGYYVNPSALKHAGASMPSIPWFMNSEVKTAVEKVPVIRPTVLNPEDPTVTLIFSNSATLSRVSGQVSSAAANSTVGIAAYREADLLVTNLDRPLTLAPASPLTKPSPGSEPSDTSAASPATEVLPEASEGTTDESAEATPETETPVDETAAEEPIANSEAEANPEAIADPEATADSETATPEAEEPTLEDPASEAVEAVETDEAGEVTEGEATETGVKLTLPQLIANGVDIVNVASDPLLQDGGSDLTQTLETLNKNSIYAVGAGQNQQEARRPRVFELKGKRIAFLSYADTAGNAASDDAAGVNVSVNGQVQADIEAIREQVDWVIVSYHWNQALRAYPEEWQVSLAHAAIDNGADLVVGYHPTMTQGSEIYKGRAIVYSLGNSVEEYNDKPAGDYETAALKVTLQEHQMQLDFLPVQVKRWQSEIASGEVGDLIVQSLKQASSLFDHPIQFPTSIDAQLNLSLPSAPNGEMPTDPFISYPDQVPQGRE